MARTRTAERAGAPRRPTGADLVSQWTHDHPRRTVCPRCETDCCRTGLHKLVYTFETCDCDAAQYPHLMEQIWHRACLAKAETDPS